MRQLLPALGLLLTPASVLAQARVTGVVEGRGGVLSGALVRVVGLGEDSRTDRAGRYRLAPLPQGLWTLRFAAVGYQPKDTVVAVPAAGEVTLRAVLEPAPTELVPLVVTGTLREQAVTESPVKVEVVSSAFLARTATSNLMEAISAIPGLAEQVDCAVCYTNSIRINGMEGPYTAVLIDGVPLMGALASVYGLNGINPSLIEQVEIVKGPSSTLYGSEALGGVINVITKDPRFTPTLAVDLSRADHGQTALDFALSPRRGGLSAMVSGTGFYNGRFLDENGDGFSDVTMDRRVSLFGKVDLDRGGLQLLGITAKAYYEDRFGGVREWRRDRDRGSSTVYGESIYTTRFELSGVYQPDLPRRNLRFQFAAGHHAQNSWYGDTRYVGRQDVVFGQMLWDHTPGARSSLLTGVAVRYHGYDDDTPATPAAEHRLVPGVFAEYGMEPGAGVSLLLGGRLDHHRTRGVIPSPRVALKVQAGDATTVRLNAGTGFRVVSLFTEDHAALTGSREVVIEESLAPERSWSMSLNLNRILEFGRNPMMLDLDLFHTRFSNRIVPDYETDPTRIHYRNLHGHAVTRGAALSLNQNFADVPFQYYAGLTVQDVHLVREGTRERQLFAPGFRASFGASHMVRNRVTLDWQGTVTGPMPLPSYPEPFARATRSPAYQVHHLQARVPLPGGTQGYLAIRNLFGYRQPSPLVDPSDPFGPHFDTAWVYGPIEGRRIVLGARWGRGR